MDVATAVPAALGNHSAIRAVRLIGSRADSRAHELSDWDFAVETDDFPSVANDLPSLVSALRPLAGQWDPYASHACYMLMLPGPTKIDLLFLDEDRDWSPPWRPSPENLVAIDRHFWDWILWLEQKRRGGQAQTLEAGLADMFELMLEPMGVAARPGSVREALDLFLAARDELERRFGVRVPRRLEQEVRRALRRHARS